MTVLLKLKQIQTPTIGSSKDANNVFPLDCSSVCAILWKHTVNSQYYFNLIYIVSFTQTVPGIHPKTNMLFISRISYSPHVMSKVNY